MTRGRILAAGLVLCALSLAAFGAAGASAEGLTAVVCEEAPGGAGTGKFETSHCETPEVGSGNFETVKVTREATTEVEGEAVGASSLTYTISLTKFQITCKEGHNTGKVTNTEEAGEKKAHGTAVVTHYTGCSAHLGSHPEGEACVVESISGTAGQKGSIYTNPLTSTTGPEHKVTFKLESGTGNVEEFNILNEAEAGSICKLPKTSVSVSGEMIAKASTEKHSHLTFEGEGTLKANSGTAQFSGTTFSYMKGSPGETVGLRTFS